MVTVKIYVQIYMQLLDFFFSFAPACYDSVGRKIEEHLSLDDLTAHEIFHEVCVFCSDAQFKPVSTAVLA